MSEGARDFAYALEGELGRGGMGVVYKARHLPTGAVRALKVLEGFADDEQQKRFRLEVEALARVSGSGIVPIHESGVHQGRFYYVMALLPGGSLRTRLRAAGRLPWDEAARLVATIARAVGRCHAAGLVHRDLKPENVLLDLDGRPWVADFGCVRVIGGERLTETGVTLGTPGYMAPEQLAGERGDPRADVFALGVILHELVTGARPFDGRSPVEIFERARAGRRDSLTTVPGVPAALERAAAHALAPHAAARPRDGAALAVELERVLAGKGPARSLSRSTIALAATAVVAGLALAAGVAASRSGREAVRERDLAEGALERARETLARAQGRGARDAAQGEWRAGLAQAREALARAGRAHALGLGEAAVVASAASALAGELASFGARRELDRGEAQAALEALADLPEDALREDARLLRARALLALGRPREAADDARRVAAKASPELLAQALELEGDACVASSTDPGRAAAAYEKALAAAPRRAGAALHEKRAVALALARDDAGALAELGAAGTAPVGSLARLAPVAPALYRRALATLDLAARERDLDLASRIGPAPAELAHAAADAWIDLCLEKATADHFQAKLETWLQTAPLAPHDLELAIRPFERAARARSMDPAATFARGRALVASVTDASRFHAGPTGALPLDEAFVQRLVAAWPDDPFALYAEARQSRAGWLANLRLATTALAAEIVPDDPDDRAHSLAEAIVEEWWRGASHSTLDVPAEAIVAVVRREERSPLWLLTRALWHRVWRHDLERAALAEAHRLEGREAKPALLRENYLKSEIEIALDEGRQEDALESACTLRMLDPTRDEWFSVLLETLYECGRFDETLLLVPADARRDRLCHRAVALFARGRADEAWAIVAELRSHGGFDADMAEQAKRRIEKIQEAGAGAGR